MNHDPHIIEPGVEDLLRNLAPAPASRALIERVEEELRLDMNWLSSTGTTARSVRWLAPLNYIALGAAAAIALMSAFSAGEGPSLPASSALSDTGTPIPVSTISELDLVEDQGIHYGTNQMPEQHILVRGTERQMFIDPRDGAEVIVEYPRQQSLVLPVNFQ